MSALTTNQKGSIAEWSVIAEAIRLGIDVYTPVSAGGRCDLLLDVAGRLLRIQCKYAPRTGDVITVSCRSSRRGRGRFVHRPYTTDEIDAIVAYCPDLDRCYLLPPRMFRRGFVRLRLGPTRNNQSVGINWAKDFEFVATLERLVGP